MHGIHNFEILKMKIIELRKIISGNWECHAFLINKINFFCPETKFGSKITSWSHFKRDIFLNKILNKTTIGDKIPIGSYILGITIGEKIPIGSYVLGITFNNISFSWCNVNTGFKNVV